MSIEDIPKPKMDLSSAEEAQRELEEVIAAMRQSFSGNTSWRTKESLERRLKVLSEGIGKKKKEASEKYKQDLKDYDRKVEEEKVRFAEEQKNIEAVLKQCDNSITSLGIRGDLFDD